MKIIPGLGILLLAFIVSVLGLSAASADPLGEGFRKPPLETRPWCYWYWINTNISKDGVTRDLEAMARVGIGEAIIGNVTEMDKEFTPPGNMLLFSERWWEILEHAVREGGRLGVNIGLFNSSGWSQSGGPWVTPGQAMRYVVASETRVTGPAKFAAKLPVPKTPFQDVAVLAFPVPPVDGDRIAAHKPRVVCTPALAGAERLVDGNLETGVAFPAAMVWKPASLTVDIEVDKPFTARSISVHPADGEFAVQCELYAADQHGRFRKIRDFPLDRRGLGGVFRVDMGPITKGPAVVSFAPVRSRKFRLVLSGLQNQGGIAEIDLCAATRLDHFIEKQLGKMQATHDQRWDAYLWPPSQEPDSSALAIAADTVQNLSDKLSPDGTLHWDVPKGEWIILRSGMTPTGAMNHPTPPEGRGFEVDKMSRDAIAAHFDAMVGKLLKRMPAADRKALRHVITDSYEVGPENWSDGFGERFRENFGYDPKPWLPVLTGRIVGSGVRSDRFLWDLRRLVADRIASEYIGGLRDVCHQHGLRLWMENYGHWGFPAEFLQYGRDTDEISGEFWMRDDWRSGLGSVEPRAASSAAHVYGKNIVHSEAFTSGGRSFCECPASIKALGDCAYCQGINHFVLHVYIHQPWQDRRPGVTADFGTEFNRHNTWFEQAKTAIDYMRRCHFLLQQGHSVAEVAYFIGEDAPKLTGTRQPELPGGYDYDYINGDALLTRARVENGCLAIPGGPSYRILVLPPQETMRPELLGKIRQFVGQGAALLGPAPRRSPSLQNYPACDDEVRRLAAEVWGDCDGKKSTERTFGKGRVFCGIDLAQALKRLGVAPTLTVPAEILWTHRRTEDSDIFFLSNQMPRPRLIDASFRVSGRRPEIWRADSGRVENTAWFAARGDRTCVPVALDPHGSAFVIFRKPLSGKTIVHVQKDGRSLAANNGPCPIQIDRAKSGLLTAVVAKPGAYTLACSDGKKFVIDAAALPPPLAVAGPWQLRFPAGSGAPEKLDLQNLMPWQKHADNSVRYYSGTATYEATFNVPANLLGNKRQLTLDLGRVGVIAEVRLNGKDLGTLWKAPYAVKITDAAKPGANTIEIKVTNTWRNRLLGDAKLPAARRKTFTTTKPCFAHKDLLPSGLIGPVRIMSAQQYDLLGPSSPRHAE
jgi:hypothetical protein